MGDHSCEGLNEFRNARNPGSVKGECRATEFDEAVRPEVEASALWIIHVRCHPKGVATVGFPKRNELLKDRDAYTRVESVLKKYLALVVDARRGGKRFQAQQACAAQATGCMTS